MISLKYKIQIGLTLRWAIATALCALVYKESGPFTAVSIFLLGSAVEISNFFITKLMRMHRSDK